VRAWLLQHAPHWCVICLEGETDGDPWQVEHYTARVDDGDVEDWRNMGRAHRSCNARGGALKRAARARAARVPADG
jgi:hypothetical protein